VAKQFQIILNEICKVLCLSDEWCWVGSVGFVNRLQSELLRIPDMISQEENGLMFSLPGSYQLWVPAIPLFNEYRSSFLRKKTADA